MPGPEGTYQSYGYGWANASNTPFRMFKQFDHEGGIRTPMIAHWPKGISRKGAIIKSVSHLIDIMPTVLEVSGLESPGIIDGTMAIAHDGHSLSAAFRGEELASHKRLFFHHSRGRALRHGKWKLVSISKKKWELYDLEADPLELHDLATKEPGRVKQLAAMWQAESARHARQAKLN